MAYYRLYVLDKHGGKIVRAIPFDCESDERAIEIAKSHHSGAAMELWQQSRMVAKIATPLDE